MTITERDALILEAHYAGTPTEEIAAMFHIGDVMDAYRLIDLLRGGE